MGTPPSQITEAIENEEGFRSHAYWDPIGQCWTVAYGETGPQVGPNTVRTRQQGVEWLQSVESSLITELKSALPWASSLSAPRFGALVDASYNLGLEGLLAFNEALTAMQAQDWIGAAKGFQQSVWDRQVPYRVDAINYMVVFNFWLENYPNQQQIDQLSQAIATGVA